MRKHPTRTYASFTRRIFLAEFVGCEHALIKYLPSKNPGASSVSFSAHLCSMNAANVEAAAYHAVTQLYPIRGVQ